jgi:CTP synthase
LGFQIATLDFARNVCGIQGANSTEFDPETKEPVIDILPEQKKLEGLGGTMRLGGKDVEIISGTKAYQLYGKSRARERFRHRYECNPKYIETLEKHGLVFSGKHPEFPIMQILELPEHPFFMATQYHAEFTSKPLEPNPMFYGFLQAVKS